MSYIGKQPTIGNFQVCDAISVVNNQAAYTMQVGSVNVSPESANHMIVSLNGVIQKPTDAFTVSGSTITFASNLVTGDVINFIQILGSVLDLGVPSDSTVSLAKLTATGTKNSTTFLRGDNTFAEAGGGSLILLSTTTVSSSVGQVNITSNIDNTYKNYLITITDYHPVTDNTFLNFRLFSSAGSPDTGSNYAYGTIGTRSDGNTSAQEFNSTGTTSGVINASNVGGDTRESTNATITLYNPSGTTYDKLIESSCVYADASGRTCSSFNVNRYIPGSGIAYTGISFFPNSGNIITGVFKLYGIN